MDGLSIKTISVIRTTRGVIGFTLGKDKQGQIFAAEVTPDEPAAKDGGLKQGDVILEVCVSLKSPLVIHWLSSPLLEHDYHFKDM